MNALRWMLAFLMSCLRYAWFFVTRPQGWRFRIWQGRHEDWSPVLCDECGWRGPRRWAVHTYGDDGSGEDVEPVDECPGCGMEI